MMSGVIRGLGAGCAAVASGVLVVAATIPAQAATSPPWRLIHQQHYGPASDYSEYDASVATSRASIWAFGGSDNSGNAGTVRYPVITHWNGKAWGAVGLPRGLTGSILAASAPAASDVWAVTGFDGWVLHWNGSKWLVAKHLPGAGELTGVVATSPANVWVFGGGGFTGGIGTWHFDGKTWRAWKSGAAVGLENGSALSAKNIWALGGTLSPYSAIDHFDGTTWRAVTAKAFSGLIFGRIGAFGAKDVWVTAAALSATTQHAYLLHYNGATWTRLSVPWPLQLGTPVSDGHGGLWFTGYPYGISKQYLVHRTAGGVWSRTQVTWSPAELALVPGTSSTLAVGWNYTRTGANAEIWANGKV